MANTECLLSRADLILMGLDRIKALRNLPKELINNNEIYLLYDQLMGNAEITDYQEYGYLMDKYLLSIANLDSSSPVEFAQTLSSAIHYFCSYVEVVLDLSPKTFTYGMYMKTYLDYLSRQKAEGDSPKPHQSLLLGALSRVSVDEHRATVQQVYPDAQTRVVDLRRTPCPSLPNHYVADATRLPFASDSFNSLHSNFLLHCLQAPLGDQTDEELQTRLWSEAHRVLKPGGALMAVEGNLEEVWAKMSFNDIAYLLEGQIRNAGFDEVLIEEAQMFPSRKELFRYLNSNSRKAELLNLCIPDEGVMAIYASKKPKPPVICL